MSNNVILSMNKYATQSTMKCATLLMNNNATPYMTQLMNKSATQSMNNNATQLQIKYVTLFMMKSVTTLSQLMV